MKKEFIGKTKNDCDVYVDMEGSHAATHIADTPQLLDLVKEIIKDVVPDDEYARFETDMGRTIGNSDLVETEEGDDVVYAKRPNRDTYSRFVKNKKPVPTSWVVVELRKVGDCEYELFTAFIGRFTPSFPGGPHETPDSKPFWSKHALAWGTQEVIPETETAECPW